MSSINKNFDVVGKEAPSPDAGANFFENEQIKPVTKPIPLTPGEKATNQTTPEVMGGPVPSYPKGAGYN